MSAISGFKENTTSHNSHNNLITTTLQSGFYYNNRINLRNYTEVKV